MGKSNAIKLFLFLGVMLLVVPACNKHKAVASKPSWVIAEDKMVDIIVDLRIVESASYAGSGVTHRNKKKDYEFVYKKYQTSDSLFKKSQAYYTDYPDVLENIYEQAIDKLSEMEAENSEHATSEKPQILPGVH